MQNFQRIRTKPEKRKIRKKERNSRSMKRRQDFADRRAMRQSEFGRATEDRVEKLLKKKLESRELISYERYPPNSLEDSQGKDFKTVQEIEKEIITATFGITTSLKCLQEHQMKHPDEPCILIPAAMLDERIWWRICKISKDKKTARA